MNILVTGSNGQLGNELRRLSALYPAHRFVFTDVSAPEGVETVFLDITSKEAVSLICESEKIDIIVNCAAYTDVAKAEDDEVFADLLNAGAVANLADAAAKGGRTLIHISTDYVFGGDSCIPYVETDSPKPLGVYGSTKLKGEEAVLHSGCNYLIFRTAWLYSPYGRNFVKTIRDRSAGMSAMKVVFDQVGTPTSAADLASLILKVISEGMTDRSGIYHFTDEGVTSWYDFALAIVRLSGNKCSILPCHSDEFPSKVRRPNFSVLDKTKVKSTFNVTIPYWLDSLEDCISRLKNSAE